MSEKQKLNSVIQSLEKELAKATGKIIIITEGKTDTKHLKTAFSNLSLPLATIKRIKYYDFGDSQTLGDELQQLLVKLSHLPLNATIIGIWDRDKHLINGKYKAFGGNVYGFAIPALNNKERSITDKISIEHYYSNAEIEMETEKGHLYMGKDFSEFGDSTDGFWHYHNFKNNNAITSYSIIDRNCKYLNARSKESKMLTKDEFADYVVDNPDKFNFTSFILIWNIIEEICSPKTSEESIEVV